MPVAPEAIADLFVTLFTPGELRAFLCGGPHGQVIAASLPSGEYTAKSFAWESATLLKRLGLLDDDFVQRLVAARPLQTSEILLASRSFRGEELGTARSLADYHDVLERRARAREWWTAPLQLMVRDKATGLLSEARSTLAAWGLDDACQHCVLLGDAGSGKTGLALWLSVELLRTRRALPIIVPAKRLAAVRVNSVEDLVPLMEPEMPAVRQLIGENANVCVVLDGLDELVGSAMQDDGARPLVAQVLRALPPGARVLVTCRGPTFPVIEQALRAALPAPTVDDDLFAGDGIVDAIAGRPVSVRALSVVPVEGASAREYLVRRGVSATVFDSGRERAIEHLLTRPFTIRLLQATLNQMKLDSDVPIHELYGRWVSASLLQWKPSLGTSSIEAVHGLLRRFAVAGPAAIPKEWEDLLVVSQVLSVRGGRLEFSHHSLWEYFLASELLRQIVSFDSTLLSRLDLVGGYNVNRFLVPMLRERLVAGRGVGASVRIVTGAEYSVFAQQTSWRRRTGYGVHPSTSASRDGTKSATFEISERESMRLHSVDPGSGDLTSGVSWYDAAAFALFSGTMLPHSEQVLAWRAGARRRVWCANWRDEERSHLTVATAGGALLEGANPDVRTGDVYLGVVS